MSIGLPARRSASRLFPGQDVAALDRAVRRRRALDVVVEDAARQVQLERDELAAVPVHRRRDRRRSARRRSAGSAAAASSGSSAYVDHAQQRALSRACACRRSRMRTWTKRRPLRRHGWPTFVDLAAGRLEQRADRPRDRAAPSATDRASTPRSADERRQRRVDDDRRGSVDARGTAAPRTRTDGPADCCRPRTVSASAIAQPRRRPNAHPANDILRSVLQPAMPRLFLIDGSSQMYRAYHAIRGLTGPDGQSTNAVYGFSTMLRKLIADHKPEFIAASFDLAGPTFRDELAADYKANRAPMPSRSGRAGAARARGLRGARRARADVRAASRPTT